MEERLQTLFQILNNGDPLTAETVTAVVRAVRPETEDMDQIRMIAAQMPASLSCLGECGILNMFVLVSCPFFFTKTAALLFVLFILDRFYVW